MKKRTLGCVCDHGTTECKDIISLCDAHRGYCGVYVCNKGLRVDKADDTLCHSEGEARRISFKACKRSFAYAQDDAQSMALNDAMNCHCERSEAIQRISVRHLCWIANRLRLLERSSFAETLRAWKKFKKFLCRRMRILIGLPRKSDDFLAMTDSRNMTKTMHNDQNGLVLMFSSIKHHKAQETKPDRCRNMFRKVGQATPDAMTIHERLVS